MKIFSYEWDSFSPFELKNLPNNEKERENVTEIRSVCYEQERETGEVVVGIEMEMLDFLI